MKDVRSQKTEVGCQRTDVRRQRTEDRSQRAEDRVKTTFDRSQTYFNPTNLTRTSQNRPIDIEYLCPAWAGVAPSFYYRSFLNDPPQANLKSSIFNRNSSILTATARRPCTPPPGAVHRTREVPIPWHAAGIGGHRRGCP